MPSKQTCKLRDACNANGISCRNPRGEFLSDSTLKRKLQFTEQQQAGGAGGDEDGINTDEVKRVLSPYFDGVSREDVNSISDEITALANAYPNIGRLDFYQKMMLDTVRAALMNKYPHLE